MNRQLLLLAGFLISLESTSGFCADDFQLKFPDDRNCGTVLIGPQPESSGGSADFHGPRRRLGIAQRSLTVPAGSFVELEINRAGAADLVFLKGLPADGIHYLKITGATFGQAEFESLARFTSLRAMLLTDCKTASKLDLTKTPAAPELQSLNFSMSGADSRQFMQAWAAKCHRLEYLYDREGSLDLQAIRHFKGHPTIDFLTVDFDQDAVEKIQALSEVPHFRGLNVQVKSDDYLEALPQLKNVELFNWSGGSIDSKVLKTFGELPYLKAIRFQGNAELAADFAQGLKYLNTVEQLVLNTHRIECPPDELQAAIVSMKRLTDIPKLTKPSKQTLDLISERGPLQSINIDGLGSDATIDQIVRLCQSKNLERVELHKMPFTREIGEALSNCPNLSFLSLDVTEFDGHALVRPELFGKLTELQIDIGETANNLMPLARLPKLQRLSLRCDSLHQIDYRFVAECRSLTAFFTYGNVVTDLAIEQIAPSQSLQVLGLGENCVVSDVGLKRLAQCHQLKNLSVGGIVSAAGIRQLGQIPGLNSLTVASLLPDSERQELVKHFDSLSSVEFREWHSPYGKLQIRSDGFWRERSFDEAEKTDAVEGQTLKAVMGSALSKEIEQKLSGKVVLVDFWGVWCGPCLGLMPDLKRFRETFGADRFEVLGIHTNRGIDGMEGFLRKNPKPWPNLADTTDELATSFAVPYYPGVYLVDRQGKIRIAIPHRLGLEANIQKLLDEK